MRENANHKKQSQDVFEARKSDTINHALYSNNKNNLS
jgi:hypothetical protein